MGLLTPLGLLFVALCGSSSAPNDLSSAPNQPNILWLLIDDLRVSVPPQRQRDGLTVPAMPNLERLARDGGVTFTHAYCQISVCAPSRNSFLTGRRPDAIAVWNWQSSFRTSRGDAAVTLPGFFKAHGYVTLGAGKTFQPGHPADYDGARSWSTEVRAQLHCGVHRRSRGAPSRRCCLTCPL